ncbi:homeobox protein cut-like isoform X2 [Condylostylus longicornis]|uniref:homeobox protein cut-like isoform X2 n=1 Tax=Condylostylus longicornis TaxID=2530218 RepID=UPI00244DDF4F|nr:homeobox protein cut-like isoform X2 [Condylostylus longicornis]
MQPSSPQTNGGTADMDLTAVQSMDWFLKKERIYLLAQFWQQRASLAEKEVNNLKEQLSSNTAVTTTPSTNSSNNSLNLKQQSANPITTDLSSRISISIPPTPQQNNGAFIAEAPSPSPPLSDTGSTTSSNNCPSNNISINKKLFSLTNNINNNSTINGNINILANNNNNNNNKMEENLVDLKIAPDLKIIEQVTNDASKISLNDNCKTQSKLNENNNNSNENNNNNNDNNTKNSNNSNSNNSNNNNLNSSNNNNSIAITERLLDELAAKDKEIKILANEVLRLKTLNEEQAKEIEKLQENIKEKIELIVRLEARQLQQQQQQHKQNESKECNIQVDESQKVTTATTSIPLKNSINVTTTPEAKVVEAPIPSTLPPTEIEIKKENIIDATASDDGGDVEDENDIVSSPPPPAITTAPSITPLPSEPKDFQELLFERTKALVAAQQQHPQHPMQLHHPHHLSYQSNDKLSSLANFVEGTGLKTSSLDFENKSGGNNLASGGVGCATSDSKASTPSLQDDRRNEDILAQSPVSQQQQRNNDILNGAGVGNNDPVMQSANIFSPLQHMPGGFLRALPFPFQNRPNFQFPDDLPMHGSMTSRLGESLIPKADPLEAKLQEMLRYNIDKFANQNLDTLYISRRVRELLSVHNIGQRIFAKYVLGLSQGTVSELLSKPKPWEKLTEKGRDSYRKMHAWACDESAVLMLKTMIPKKDTGFPQYDSDERSHSMKPDSVSNTPTAAASILNRGNHQTPHMEHSIDIGKDVDVQQHNEESRSPLPNACSSPIYKDNTKFNKTEDFAARDKIARSYQEEFAKMMMRSQKEEFPSPFFSQFHSGGMPPSPQMHNENIRLAIENYHRELAKLQNFPSLLALQHQNALAMNGSVQDLSISKDKDTNKTNSDNQSKDSYSINEQSNQKPDDTNDLSRDSFNLSLSQTKQQQLDSNKSNNSFSRSDTPMSAPSPLVNSILPPAITPNDDFSTSVSPLQRMASITNSLITQPPIPQHHQTPQRPKTVLPPITQQQFDLYNNLNTEDIVRRVKEALSQYSISQRLFGESILGLSQGSVSDLLARPKPWHMLTQKGREPFIRMQMFLEDDNAVHKLVASQYKIAPEKLMRTGSAYNTSPQIPGNLVPKLEGMTNMPLPKSLADMKNSPESLPQHIMQQMRASIMARFPGSAAAAAAAAASVAGAPGIGGGGAGGPHQGMLLTSPGLPPQHAINLQNSQEKKQLPQMIPSHIQQQVNSMRGQNQHVSPTVYEMAALTQDLDTQVITTRIKEALLANNIGQKIFGEAVLGLSQGSVSELLSKPKPWHMLSIKGREPFIRMQLWLSDANNVERLQTIKTEKREASKRRRSIGMGGGHDNNSDSNSNDTNDFYTNSPDPNSVGSSGTPPNKKQRVLFSEEQKEALRLAFALDPYPNVATIEFLANELGLATRTITNWFHNHRMRLKQQMPHGAPNEPIPSRENQTGAPLNPVQFKILLSQRLMELQKEKLGLSGMPLLYPPYFAANPNLAALIGGGLLPSNENELQVLNAAFKEQMNCLDLSVSNPTGTGLPTIKKENDLVGNDYIDEDSKTDINDNETGSNTDINELNNNSSNINDNLKSPSNDTFQNQRSNQEDESNNTFTTIDSQSQRSSRRKANAPQWVNPDWQDELGTKLSTSQALAPTTNINLAEDNNNSVNKNIDDETDKEGKQLLGDETNYSASVENNENSQTIIKNEDTINDTKEVGSE